MGAILRCTSFNPRTPCGVRHAPVERPGISDWFQSTHSLRSATVGPSLDKTEEQVSIHALLAECDRGEVPGSGLHHRFNPRTPCGVRPGAVSCGFRLPGFNPRTPCGVRRKPPRLRPLPKSFNPRTPCGVRQLVLSVTVAPGQFQSTHSLRSAT